MREKFCCKSETCVIANLYACTLRPFSFESDTSFFIEWNWNILCSVTYKLKCHNVWQRWSINRASMEAALLLRIGQCACMERLPACVALFHLLIRCMANHKKSLHKCGTHQSPVNSQGGGGGGKQMKKHWKVSGVMVLKSFPCLYFYTYAAVMLKSWQSINLPLILKVMIFEGCL